MSACRLRDQLVIVQDRGVSRPRVRNSVDVLTGARAQLAVAGTYAAVVCGGIVAEDAVQESVALIGAEIGVPG